MKQNKGFANIVMACLMIAPLGLAPACGDDDMGNDDTGDDVSGGNADGNDAGAGPANTGGTGNTGGAGSAIAGSLGAGTTSVSIDYTRCEERECDPQAMLDGDVSGPWKETMVFNSNDCASGIQALLPPGFETEGLTFGDMIVGNCFRPEPSSSIYTGVIANSLSEAEYCTRSTEYIESQKVELEFISHVRWESIEESSITGTVAVYVPAAGCVLHGDYSLTKIEE